MLRTRERLDLLYLYLLQVCEITWTLIFELRHLLTVPKCIMKRICIIITYMYIRFFLHVEPIFSRVDLLEEDRPLISLECKGVQFRIITCLQHVLPCFAVINLSIRPNIGRSSLPESSQVICSPSLMT